MSMAAALYGARRQKKDLSSDEEDDRSSIASDDSSNLDRATPARYTFASLKDALTPLTSGKMREGDRASLTRLLTSAQKEKAITNNKLYTLSKKRLAKPRVVPKVRWDERRQNKHHSLDSEDWGAWYREYGETYKVQEVFAELLGEVMTALPPDPFEYMVSRLKGLAETLNIEIEELRKPPVRVQKIQELFSVLDDGSNTASMREVLSFGKLIFFDESADQDQILNQIADSSMEVRIGVDEVVQFYANGVMEDLTDDEFCELFDVAFAKFQVKVQADLAISHLRG